MVNVGSVVIKKNMNQYQNKYKEYKYTKRTVFSYICLTCNKKRFTYQDKVAKESLCRKCKIEKEISESNQTLF